MNKLITSKPISMKNINIKNKFWSSYIDLARNVVIPYQWDALNDRIEDGEPSHSIKNFRIAAGLEEGEFQGMVFQDSDVSKWLEAVGYSLETNPDPELESIADGVIDIIEKAQQPDGYLDTYFILKEPDKKWTNLEHCHELYCAGHFIEAAVAYYNATHKEKVLNIACKLADNIDNTFGPEEGKIHGYDGHQEIELALVKLYRTTGNEKYLKLSKYFLDERGKQPAFFDLEFEKRGKTEHFKGLRSLGNKYNQTHLPVREQNTAEGHAVRLVYMCIAMADVAAETGDIELFNACKKLWNNIVERRMYLTGGIGSDAHGEAFTYDYDLPNDTAYAETCASIGLVFFSHKMLQIEPNSRYADVMERALYNTVIGGMSQDGKRFFYVNPLEVVPEGCEKNHTKQHVKPTRQKWFGCACCPPNVTRTLTSLGQYIYTSNDDTVYTNLYIGGEAVINIGDQSITLIQETQYPWDETVSIKVLTDEEKQFSIALRIPGWCSKAELSVNGEVLNANAVTSDGYAIINRCWKDGDSIVLTLAMPVLRIKANPKVREAIGKVALQRGPLVYCLEEADNGSGLHGIVMPEDAELNAGFEPDLLGGVGTITATALRLDEKAWGNELYKADVTDEFHPVEVKFIPYYAWANRNVGEMNVWVNSK